MAQPPATPAGDWLRLLPDCDPAPSPPAQAALRYPRPGLPALVHAGATLVVRVALPTALTPPPGVQQDRVLVGWHAELRGGGLPLDPGLSPDAHRHPLSVYGVRPDAARSMVYRARIAVPAWVAPGSYELRLSLPDQELPLSGGPVRVLAPGSGARVGRGPGPAQSGQAALLPVDLWLAGEAPAPAALGVRPAPALEVEAGAFALQLGPRLWISGHCDDRRLPFEAGARAVAAAEGLELTRSPPAGSATGAGQAPLQVARGEGWLRLSLPAAAGTPLELPILARADGRAIAVEGASIDWYPASAVGAAAASEPLIVGLVRLEPGARVRLSRRPGAALSPRLTTRPLRPHSGQTLEVLPPAGAAGTMAPRLALNFGGGRTAFGRAAVRHRVLRPGLHAVTGLAITGDGRVGKVRHEIEVASPTAGSCGVGRSGARPGPGLACAMAGVASLGLMLRRRRRRRK